jgi:ribosome biogenesis GTPase / thiamine phosphate phosphatase
MIGIVIEYHSNYYTVQTASGTWVCFLKGLLKKDGQSVLVGDRVVLDNLDMANQSARIVEIQPRSSELQRPKVANIHRALIVGALKTPTLSLEQLDRYITHIQLAGLPCSICLTKIDLLEEGDTRLATLTQQYQALGISVFGTSIYNPESITTLLKHLQHQTVVLAGPSGVGKSSLLNAIDPALMLEVKALSEKLQRGQHTTRSTKLITLPENVLIADSPGFSLLKFDTLSPLEIEACFAEFAPYRSQCRYPDCLHLSEADCAVKQNESRFLQSRMHSYYAFIAEAQLAQHSLTLRSQKELYGKKTMQRGKNQAIDILRLNEKHRQSARNTQKQRLLYQDEMTSE